MDPVHRGGPWTRSTWPVHGPGSMFCIRPFSPFHGVGMDFSGTAQYLFTCKRHLILSQGIMRTAPHAPANIPAVKFWKLLIYKTNHI